MGGPWEGWGPGAGGRIRSGRAAGGGEGPGFKLFKSLKIFNSRPELNNLNDLNIGEGVPGPGGGSGEGPGGEGQDLNYLNKKNYLNYLFPARIKQFKII